MAFSVCRSAVLPVGSLSIPRPAKQAASSGAQPAANSKKSAFLGAPASRLHLAPAKAALPQAATLTVQAGLAQFLGGDLIKGDLGQWLDDVENYGAVGCFTPPEGGYEGRYASRLKGEGFHILNLTAKGLGDLEGYLMRTHGVTPPHLGRQALTMFFEPGLLEHRLSVIPDSKKGVVLWIIEGKVLSRAELRYLSLLPGLVPNVRVVVEVGSSRGFEWKPLIEIAEGPTIPAQCSPAP
eukprot:jgi/Mesvir1/5547/Mv15578-RA.1